MSEASNSAERGLSRRRLLVEGAATACGVALFGLGLGLYARRAGALPPQAIRPPGALPEAGFAGACIRCGMCVRDCPYDILDLARLGDEVPLGTPYFTARTGPCRMCEDIPCVKACPTDALDHRLTDIAKARMGLAVLIDHETCLAYLGLRCEVCFNVCPVRGQAISLEFQHNERSGKHAFFIPVVHSTACTGCGMCEQACVLEEAAIKVLPAHLAKGRLGGHYRLGWVEKEHAGHALVAPDPEHHYNLPEGMRYELQGRGLVTEPGTPSVEAPMPGSANPLETLNRGLDGGAALMAENRTPAARAVAEKGWLRAHRWLLLRRLVQLGVLGLFLAGPLAGVWVVKGNLAFSETLGVLPLTDPYLLLQARLSGVRPEARALLGAALVLGFYWLVGGRVYCAWVCPVNPVTDAAGWLRRRLGLHAGARISRRSRYGLLAATLILTLATGAIVWELVNPVSLLFRGLVFGLGLGWVLIAGIFLFDLLVARDGWCGRLCPVGAFWGLIGRAGVVRVVAARRAACDDCLDCFAVCPEAQVIRPALKGAGQGSGPVIRSGDCTHCGRCIDVCAREVFRFGSRSSRDETG